MTRFRAVFFGTPQFAVPTLRALYETADVAAVVTQPDRPAGRGQKLTPPPIKLCADAHQTPVLQPKSVRTEEFRTWLAAQHADVGVVVAYGRILPQAVLDTPRLGCINVHASLLPRWRGAAPITWSIVEGDSETGVTLMRMDAGLDTGPMLATRRTAIGVDETAGDLGERLALLGAELIRDELPAYVRGALTPVAQDDARATHARLLEKRDGLVRWSAPAAVVHNQVRGMSPWPGAFTSLAGERIRLLKSAVYEVHGAHGQAGAILGTVAHHGVDALRVACGSGTVALTTLQPEGKRAMDVRAFLAGRNLAPGAAFETGEL